MSKTNNERGFTIVELLIVIVVIAILAAISIVAYNGIQQRARNTTVAESASQLKTKIEAWNGVKGSYPTTTEVTDGLVDSTVKEAALDDALKSKVGTSAPAAAIPLQVAPCPATGTQTGISITYLVEGGTNAVIKLGVGCP